MNNNFLTSPDTANHQLLFELAKYSDKLLLENIESWIAHCIDLSKTIKSEMQEAFSKADTYSDKLIEMLKKFDIEYSGGTVYTVFYFPNGVNIKNQYIANYVNSYIQKTNDYILRLNQLEAKYKNNFNFQGIIFDVLLDSVKILLQINRWEYSCNCWDIENFKFDGQTVVKENKKLISYIFDQRISSIFNQKISTIEFNFCYKNRKMTPKLKAKYCVNKQCYAIKPKQNKQAELFGFSE